MLCVPCAIRMCSWSCTVHLQQAAARLVVAQATRRLAQCLHCIRQNCILSFIACDMHWMHSVVAVHKVLLHCSGGCCQLYRTQHK